MINFGTLLQLIRSNVDQRIINDSNLDREDKLCQINHCDKTALHTFIAGGAGVLKNYMHLKKPDSLEDVMTYVQEFSNFCSLYSNFGEQRN